MKSLLPLFLIILLPCLVQAGPKRVHIIGGLYYPDGSLVSTVTVSPTIQVELSSNMLVSDSNLALTTKYKIPKFTYTFTVTDSSNVNLYLPPTTNSSPTGVHYKVFTHTDLGNFTEIWLIPDTTSDTNIANVIIVQ